MIEKTMDNPGERAIAERSQRCRRMTGVYVAAAALIVMGTWLFKRDGGQIAPSWAVTLSLLYAAILIVGGWLTDRQSDEVEWQYGLFATSFAARFYMLAFPVWYFLAKGQLAPEPDQLLLFVGFVVMGAVGYTFKKLT